MQSQFGGKLKISWTLGTLFILLLTACDLPPEWKKSLEPIGRRVVSLLGNLSHNTSNPNPLSSGDTITLQDIFTFETDLTNAKQTETGTFKVTGLVPTFVDQLREQGIELPRNYFGG